MRLAFDAAKIGLWDWNIATNDAVWSAAASGQMGQPEDSPTSFELFMNSVHPDDRKTMQESIENAVRNNGERAMVGISIDIDDQKAANERLLLQVAALQAAANSIVITDNQGTILWFNQAFSQLTGYRSEEVLGKNPRFLKSGEHGSAFYKDMWLTIASGNTWHGEITNRRKNGSLYAEEMTITPVRFSNDEITHYVAIKQDVTSRKIAEDKLRRAEATYRSIFEDAHWNLPDHSRWSSPQL
jgi:PAS domain S-box-containing protein